MKKERPPRNDARLKVYLTALGAALCSATGIAYFGAHVIPDHRQSHDSAGTMWTRRLVDALVVDHELHRAPDYVFPELTPTPPESALAEACARAGRGAEVSLVDHVAGNPTWSRLGLPTAPLDPTDWSLSISSEGSGGGATAVVRATRDYDCDGVWWVVGHTVRVVDGVATFEPGRRIENAGE